MSSSPDKVHSLEEVKRIQSGREGDEAETRSESEAWPQRGHDMSKWAMVVALLSLVLVLVFFFGLTQNVSGVAGEVEAVSELKTDVEGLRALVQGTNEYVVGLDERLGQVEAVQSGLVRQAVLQGLLADLRVKAAALEGALQDPAQAEKLAQVRALLDELSVSAP